MAVSRYIGGLILPTLEVCYSLQSRVVGNEIKMGWGLGVGVVCLLRYVANTLLSMGKSGDCWAPVVDGGVDR